ncbi:hypothetical protein LMG26411_06913 [Cupriavidus numazuensis]|uniref:Secreted protein n=1 Tax=Cupriavidus numazuensis TaxID=221992 RepID=A0ABM8TTC5_9BURK|nr:hypothetical protein LMG26411_06913 [Cupriavidus numazuensis]
MLRLLLVGCAVSLTQISDIPFQLCSFGGARCKLLFGSFELGQKCVDLLGRCAIALNERNDLLASEGLLPPSRVDYQLHLLVRYIGTL